MRHSSDSRRTLHRDLLLLHQGRWAVAAAGSGSGSGSGSGGDQTVADTAAGVARRMGRCCIGFGDLSLDRGRCSSPAVGKSQ